MNRPTTNAPQKKESKMKTMTPSIPHAPATHPHSDLTPEFTIVNSDEVRVGAGFGDDRLVGAGLARVAWVAGGVGAALAFLVLAGWLGGTEGARLLAALAGTSAWLYLGWAVMSGRPTAALVHGAAAIGLCAAAVLTLSLSTGAPALLFAAHAAYTGAWQRGEFGNAASRDARFAWIAFHLVMAVGTLVVL